MRKLIIALSALSIVAASSPTFAAQPCRDAKGKFIKCATKSAKPTRCRDAKGKFVKCTMKGAKPA